MERALIGMREQFKSGLISNKDLLSFEAGSIEAEIRLLETQRNQRVANYELFLITETLNLSAIPNK